MAPATPSRSLSELRYTLVLHEGIALFAEEVWDSHLVDYHIDRNADKTTTYSFKSSSARNRARLAVRRAVVRHLIASSKDMLDDASPTV